MIDMFMQLYWPVQIAVFLVMVSLAPFALVVFVLVCVVGSMIVVGLGLVAMWAWDVVTHPSTYFRRNKR